MEGAEEDPELAMAIELSMREGGLLACQPCMLDR
jgi:hypothetical protein